MIRRALARGLALALVLLATPAGPAAAGAGDRSAVEGAEIPAHPSQLRFEPLPFEVPDPARYRHDLSSGVTVWIAEDHDLPLVDVNVQLRAGGYLDPPGAVGLAAMTAAMLRDGGTATLTAEAFDERADFLAAQIYALAGDTSASAGFNCTSFVLSDCLDLFFEMLRSPRFQQDRLDVRKANRLEAMKQRNDSAAAIHAREWSFLMWGEDDYRALRMTAADLEAIDAEAMRAFHRKYWHPGNMIFQVAGDVDSGAILAEIDRRLADWPEGGTEPSWPPPEPKAPAPRGVFHVEKDIPQGRVAMGHRVPKRKSWDDPRPFHLRVMNSILGGSGFTSRITKRIRSDEGLAYSAGSRLDVGLYGPGSFQVFYQSKNPTVAWAAAIALEEIERIRREPVSREELAVAINSIVETFPARFESPRAITGTFSGDQAIGRPHDYWVHYRDRIRAVTAEDVLTAARETLRPEDLVMLVVGRWDEIAPGDPDGHASMKEILGGEVTHVPLRDPLTLEPIEETAAP